MLRQAKSCFPELKADWKKIFYVLMDERRASIYVIITSII